MRRMMDHEVVDGKLVLKEDDILLYEKKDPNVFSATKVIIRMVLIAAVVIVLLRNKIVVLCLFLHSLDTVVVVKMDFDKFDFALFIKDETAAPEELKVRKVLYQGICNTEE